MTFRDYCDMQPRRISPRTILAEKLVSITGCTKQTVYKWMSGKLLPSKKNRYLIAAELGNKVEELWPGAPL